MNVEIYLENKFFPWNKTEENNIKCWMKGNVFYNDKTLQGSEIISLVSSLPNTSRDFNEALKDLLLNLNGSFAIVIETPDCIFCVVDRVRSIPLFYAKTDAGFTISDDANYIKNQIGRAHV
jgi:asparagine synthase (glutamine-hydrolysing)